MRVHELAKSLGVSSKELMDELHAMKVDVEHHSNALDDETVRKVMGIYNARRGGGVVKKITKKKAPAASPEPAAPGAGMAAPRLVKKKVVVKRVIKPAAPKPPVPGAPQSIMPPPPQRPGMPPLPPPVIPTPMSGQPPIAPPTPIRPTTPSSIQPPSPIAGAPGIAPPQPLTPPAPSAPSEPAAQETPEAPPTSSTSAPSTPSPASKRPVKRERTSAQPKKRGVTIDLDTFKEVATGQTPTAKPDERPRRKPRKRPTETPDRTVDGAPQRRRPAGGQKDHKFRPSFLLKNPQVAGGFPGGQRRPGGGGGGQRRPGQRPRQQAPAIVKPKAVTIYGEKTVGDFAQKIGVEAMDVIKKLMELGEMMNINALLPAETAEILATEFNIELTIIPETDEYDVKEYAIVDEADDMITRPPVVTVMGHVDHGKTSLLDKIRSSKVAAGEAGGITQHVGASVVETSRGTVTFLDTPGHEAFTAMRARGANVTDIVILVVAADDGVMPQTIEAINHSKAAGVPIVVAINKMDVAGANPERSKQGLMQYGLIPEELGGDVACVPVSAHTGEGIDDLLEMVALQAEVLELRANPKRHGEGVVVESRVDAGRGVSATVLVQKGTLRVGDAFLSGPEFGKIRSMNNHLGKPVQEVGPGFAAEVVGLKGSPIAGEQFLVVPNERIAREIAERRSDRRRQKELASTPGAQIAISTAEGAESLDIIAAAQAGETKEFKIILRADVQGTVEAVSQSLLRLSNQEVKVVVVHSGVGAITVSDVTLAMTTGAQIIGFGVRPEPQAAQMAERERVKIHLNNIIYELIDIVKSSMTGLLEPTFEEKTHGHAEIRQVFRTAKLGNIAGCYVTDGEIRRNLLVRIIRDGAVVTEKRKLAGLRRVKEDVTKVSNGLECGISIEGFNDIKEGDVIEAYSMEEVQPVLMPSDS